jgi:hypothetical protein
MEKVVGGVASWVYDLFAANGYNHGKNLFTKSMCTIALTLCLLNAWYDDS